VVKPDAINPNSSKRRGEVLTILVQTPTLLDNAQALTQAACRKGKQVRLHVSGKGVPLVKHPGFDWLCRHAETTVCRDCLLAAGVELDTHLCARLVPRGYQVELLEASTRVVVL
jgi:hypothetical protein